jgi:hypothetical protein
MTIITGCQFYVFHAPSPQRAMAWIAWGPSDAVLYVVNSRTAACRMQ